jgi:hypothetical protein
MDFRLSTEPISRRRRHATDVRPDRLQRVTNPDSERVGPRHGEGGPDVGTLFLQGRVPFLVFFVRVSVPLSRAPERPGSLTAQQPAGWHGASARTDEEVTHMPNHFRWPHDNRLVPEPGPKEESSCRDRLGEGDR